jgi:hypothetical protein
MKRVIRVAALLGLVATGALVTNSFAQCPTLTPSSPLIEFDANSFAYETAYTPATFTSAPGSLLTMVGIIDLFYAPLNFLNPADPNVEYTFVVSSLTSVGTVTIPAGPTTFYETDYTGGVFTIYSDMPEDAPLAGVMPALPAPGVVPDLFQDGTAILSGTLCGMHTSVSKTGTNPANGSFKANYEFTGGTLFGYVGDGDAIFTGNWCPANSSRCTLPAGYSAHPNGKWDISPTTPAKRSTWGTIKTLYR